jgi:hypothetical protein
MNVITFNTYEEVNEFVKTVKLDHIEARESDFVVFYRPYLTKEEVKAQKILEDRNTAEVGLQQAKMHLDYLNEVKKSGSDKVDSGIKNTQENINNHKASLTAIEKWESK